MTYATHHFASATKASSADVPPAAYLDLGLRYCLGRDVKLDLVEAHKWFNLAAMAGSRDGLRYRTEVASEMSRADVCRAQRLAREWLSRH
jgi:hypothetical protein